MTSSDDVKIARVITAKIGPSIAREDAIALVTTCFVVQYAVMASSIGELFDRISRAVSQC